MDAAAVDDAAAADDDVGGDDDGGVGTDDDYAYDDYHYLISLFGFCLQFVIHVYTIISSLI